MIVIIASIDTSKPYMEYILNFNDSLEWLSVPRMH